MKKRTLLLLLIVAFVCAMKAMAGTTYPANSRIDSLTRLLAATKSDTAKLKIRYALALETTGTDAAVWEGLLTEARQQHLTLYEVFCLMKLGEIHRKKSDVQKMKSSWFGALLLAQKCDYKPEVLLLYKKLQAYYSELLDTKRSLYFIYKGLKVAEVLNDKESIIHFYSQLSVFYFTAKDLQKALDIQFRCLEKCRAMKYDFGICSALLDIGTIYESMGRLDKTTEYYQQSAGYIHAVAGTIFAVQVYSSLAVAYRYKQQFDSAAYFVDKAYRFAVQLKDQRMIASTLVSKGLLESDIHKFALAEHHALEALRIAKEVQFNVQLSSVYVLLEKIYTGQRNYGKALAAYKAHINFRDSLSNEATRKQGAEKEFAYNLEKKENEYKLLAQQNQIKDLRLRENEYMLRQNRYLATGAMLTVLVLGGIVYLVIRQNRFRAGHQRLMLEQKLLRAQMNPHFVFNSLNSIQGFIMEKENDQAERYLSKFATLIRDLLESSIKDNLTVAEEISMLAAYLEMEELRFGASFAYAIEVDPRIDRHHTAIPHLMIQPFVENAIWHGLLPKKGEQALSIRFEYHSDTTLKCTVEDNGVGREASVNIDTTFRRKSLALSFVKQRIELIRKTYKIDGSTDIIDKKDAQGNSLGTTVIIILPILKT